MSNNVWDSGRWAFVKEVKIDFMTRYIIEHMMKHVSFSGRTMLELGAGTGRLSYLALQQGAKKVTLVDSSRKALELSKQLFKDEKASSYDIVDSGILEYDPGTTFDVVFSSGVVEHFKGPDRFSVVQKHLALASRDCLIIHPTKTLYSIFFCNFPVSQMLYGYQEPFPDDEMAEAIGRAGGAATSVSERFHPFYTVPLLHNWEWINRSLDGTGYGKRHGGNTITHCVMK
jgi:phospholipid N-methyltransferase